MVRKKLVISAFLVALLILVTANMGFAAGFDWKQQAGKTINLILVDHPYTDAMIPFFPEFEKLTGIKVNYEHLPENQFREKLLTDLSTRGSAYDGFMTGYITDWQYAAGGWVEPLDKYINDPKLTAPDWDFSDFFDTLIKVNRWNGQPGKGVGEGPLYALPVNEEGYALFYRKDIFEKEGLRVPTTWTELIQDAAKLNGKVYDGQKISG